MDVETIKMWMQEHSAWLGSLAAVSVVTFVLSLLLVPWIMTRLPADYFVRADRRALQGLLGRPVLRRILLGVKNLLGGLLFLGGLAMLVLPGQGLLTLFAAFLLLDFPGKFHLESRLMRTPRVLHVMNRLRIRAGVPPFEPRTGLEP